MSSVDNLADGQFGKVNCIDCGKPLKNGTTHLHLSEDDVNAWKALAAASDAHHKAAHAAHYQPFNVNDTEALRAHLKSPGHYMHPESVDNTEHEWLTIAHDNDHSDMDEGPEDEREFHTTIGNRHKHVERP